MLVNVNRPETKCTVVLSQRSQKGEGSEVHVTCRLASVSFRWPRKAPLGCQGLPSKCLYIYYNLCDA